ncbi:zinc metalloproteinase-disintegrin-like MTP8 [Acanthaster planci]|uniref:Zinc metalloproteinase-disintegrin-like MTP8 n=1 Tax=Acanthaster planci TaxID=133434 RepID=A0A8B7ZAF5_ACAPL|nr:zinc metalloproteinase-disintegrin-like MTP8 [Acanthaster planci]
MMLSLALCLCLTSSVFAGPAVPHHRFDNEELQRYFGVDSHEKAPEYEIVYPQYVTADSKRDMGRSAVAASYLDVHVEAFGEAFHMALEHDDSNFKPGLEAHYVTEEGTIKVPVRTDCIYTGKVVGEVDSLVSVTTCAGLMAVMNHASGPTYIEPLDDEHAFKRDIGRGLPHVAYKNRPDNGATCPVTPDSEFVVYENKETNDDKDDVDPESTKYLELALVGDAVLYDLRGGNTQHCLTTLFNAVKNVMQLSSLAGSNLVPQLESMIIFTSAQSGLNTCPDASQSIGYARSWHSSVSRSWDNAAVLTGWEMNSGRTLGIAYVGSCGTSYSISVSTFRNLDTTNVLAHEIGHNLSMQHDSDGNSCSSSGYIMAAIVNDHRADPNWSSCSRSYYNNFVGSRSCYNDS